MDLIWYNHLRTKAKTDVGEYHITQIIAEKTTYMVELMWSDMSPMSVRTTYRSVKVGESHLIQIAKAMANAHYKKMHVPNRVARDSTKNCILIDDVSYSISALRDAAIEKLRPHTKNIGYHMPPFFYTGSPYADAMLALGVEPMGKIPKNFKAECVPRATTPAAMSQNQIWPKIFNVNKKYHYMDELC